MFDSLQRYGLLPTRCSVHGILQARILEWILRLSPEDLPDSGIELVSLLSLHWQAGSLLPEPPGSQNLIKTKQFPQRHWGFHGGSDSRESACNAGNWVQFTGWEDPLEKEMAPHPIILAWRIPWTEKHDRLQSMGVPKSQT